MDSPSRFVAQTFPTGDWLQSGSNGEVGSRNNDPRGSLQVRSEACDVTGVVKAQLCVLSPTDSVCNDSGCRLVVGVVQPHSESGVVCASVRESQSEVSGGASTDRVDG